MALVLSGIYSPSSPIHSTARPTLSITPTMNYWKSGLNSVQSDYAYTRLWSPLPLELRILLRVLSWLGLLLSGALRFPHMNLLRRLLGRLCLVMLLGMGCLYAVCLNLSDWHYAQGFNLTLPPKDRVEQFRLANQFYPLDWRNRLASAGLISNLALASNDQGWLNAAQIENRKALVTDATDATLIQKAILIDLAFHDDKEAEVYYQQLKRIDRKSPIHELVANSHQQQAEPSPAIPDGN
jgi:hypothetical protein